MLRCDAYTNRSDCDSQNLCSWLDNAQQCQQKSGGLAIAVLEASRASPSPPPTGASGLPATLGYEIDRASSIDGPILASHTVCIDAAKPDPAVASCARFCNGHVGCSAFDISMVYGKCTLYRSVDKTTPLGGYISGRKAAH